LIAAVLGPAGDEQLERGDTSAALDLVVGGVDKEAAGFGGRLVNFNVFPAFHTLPDASAPAASGRTFCYYNAEKQEGLIVRTIIAICAGLVALSAASVQATPLPPAEPVSTELTLSPPIELAAEGCGYGQRRTRWQDQWGHWHWGRCVPKSWGSLSRHQFTH
jgi:hypothetical protein